MSTRAAVGLTGAITMLEAGVHLPARRVSRLVQRQYCKAGRVQHGASCVCMYVGDAGARGTSHAMIMIMIVTIIPSTRSSSLTSGVNAFQSVQASCAEYSASSSCLICGSSGANCGVARWAISGVLVNG